jgi:hypothetical protein
VHTYSYLGFRPISGLSLRAAPGERRSPGGLLGVDDNGRPSQGRCLAWCEAPRSSFPTTRSFPAAMRHGGGWPGLTHNACSHWARDLVHDSEPPVPAGPYFVSKQGRLHAGLRASGET